LIVRGSGAMAGSDRTKYCNACHGKIWADPHRM
jgi:hypothetical protein